MTVRHISYLLGPGQRPEGIREFDTQAEAMADAGRRLWIFGVAAFGTLDGRRVRGKILRVSALGDADRPDHVPTENPPSAQPLDKVAKT